MQAVALAAEGQRGAMLPCWRQAGDRKVIGSQGAYTTTLSKSIFDMAGQPESKNGIIGASSSLMGLTLIAVGLRLYARRRQRVRFMADDAFAVVSLVAFFGAAIVVFILVHKKAFGYPLNSAAGTKFSTTAQIALDVLSNTSNACTKLSALFFYRRIFCVKNAVNKWFNRTVIALVVIVVLWLVTYQFLAGFQCGTHFSALWDGDYIKYCTISDPFLESLSISDFILDVIILCLPIPRVLQLHATLLKKLAVIGIFLTALVGLGAACARMVEYITLTSIDRNYFLHHDEERAVTEAFYFTILEAGISLISVNLPTLWFLFTSVTPDTVVRSIRSMLSLPSIGSNRSGNGVTGPGGESTVAVGRPSQTASARTMSIDDEEAQRELTEPKSQIELRMLDNKSCT
ncbi:hypothetical protein GGR56DRAFT_615469 [Xylariaceae sp. FL0804]|nr:hypothetical protein GGR56DRAFT_615469 [Xylariaceae sp. FL0804]